MAVLPMNDRSMREMPYLHAHQSWPSPLQVQLLLFTISALNFADRQIMAILMQPMAEDLSLTDSELGLLSGLAFTLFYALLGIPIARWADRGHQALIIGCSVGFWSLMTVLCGLASNFAQLIVARLGVGVGEAGVSPAAYSYIADRFRAAGRTTAVATYSAGMPAGIMLGYLVGGWINELLGWRAAFIIMGLPGLLLSVTAFRSLRHLPSPSPRIQPPTQPVVPFADVLRILVLTPSLRCIVGGFAVASFVSYGVGLWVPVYLIRIYGMGTAEVGTWLALIIGVMATAGIFVGGFVGDRFGQRDIRWYVRFPAYALLLAIPFSVLFAFAPTKWYALAALFPIAFLGYLDIGPILSLVQSVVPVRARATTIAVVLMITNFAGLGFGPLIIGLLSDALNPHFGSDALRYAILSGLFLFAVAAALLWRAGASLRFDIARSAGFGPSTATP